MESRRAQKELLQNIRSRKVHIRTIEPYFVPIGSKHRGLEVQQEHKAEYWRLHSSVNGKILAAYPYAQPGELGWVARELAIMPDRTTLSRLDQVLRGKKPEDVKQDAMQRAIVAAFAALMEHRKALEDRLKRQSIIPWHET